MGSTCKSLSTSMSLTGRQTAVLQNITCVWSLLSLLQTSSAVIVIVIIKKKYEMNLMISRVGSDVLAVSRPVELDHVGRVAEAATQPVVLPVVLLHLVIMIVMIE